jgi:hypothetical protein
MQYAPSAGSRNALFCARSTARRPWTVLVTRDSERLTTPVGFAFLARSVSDSSIQPTAARNGPSAGPHGVRARVPSDANCRPTALACGSHPLDAEPDKPQSQGLPSMADPSFRPLHRGADQLRPIGAAGAQGRSSGSSSSVTATRHSSSSERSMLAASRRVTVVLRWLVADGQRGEAILEPAGRDFGVSEIGNL